MALVCRGMSSGSIVYSNSYIRSSRIKVQCRVQYCCDISNCRRNIRGTKARATSSMSTEHEPSEGCEDKNGADFSDDEPENEKWDDVDFKAAKQLANTLAQLKMNEVAKVVPEIEKWRSEGNAINKHTLLFVIKKLRKRNRLPHAMRISDWMAFAKPVPQNTADIIRRIDLQGRCCRTADAEKLFYGIPEKERTEAAYNAILLAYVKDKRLNKAESIFNKLKAEKMVTTMYAFNLMASLYRSRGFDGKVLALNQELEKFDVNPDTCFYNILLGSSYKVNGIKEAENIFQRIIERDERDHITTYVTMANCYISENMKKHAEAVLGKIRRGMDIGQFPKIRTTYNAVITMYATLKNGEGLSGTWDDMLKLGEPISQDYICVVKAWGKLGNIEKAEEAFKEAEAKDKLKNSPIFGALLYCYSKMQMMDRAEALVERMQKELMVPLNPWCYYHLIAVYIGKGKLDEAVSVLRNSQVAATASWALRMRPMAASLGLILTYTAKTKDVPLAEQLLEDWKASGNQVSAGLYNKLLDVYIAAGQPATGMLDRMLKDKIRPNEQTGKLFDEINRKVKSLEKQELSETKKSSKVELKSSEKQSVMEAN